MNNEGTYTVTIETQGLSVAKTGTEYIFFTFKPDGKYERTAKLYLTDKTIDRTLDDLAKLGIQGFNSFGDLDPDSNSGYNIVGNEVEMECRHEQGQDGKTYERWGVPYTPAAKDPPVPATTKAIRGLDALFGKALKSRKASGPTPPRDTAPLARQPDNTITGVSAGPAVPTQGGDDIPFAPNVL